MVQDNEYFEKIKTTVLPGGSYLIETDDFPEYIGNLETCLHIAYSFVLAVKKYAQLHKMECLNCSYHSGDYAKAIPVNISFEDMETIIYNSVYEDEPQLVIDGLHHKLEVVEGKNGLLCKFITPAPKEPDRGPYDIYNLWRSTYELRGSMGVY